MLKITRWGWATGLAMVTALGLTACGGNDSLPPKASISKVYVMGDSLADVGTFGYKFTVQGAQIWPQLIANLYGLNGSGQCNVYAAASSAEPGQTVASDFSLNTTPGCTNFAIGASRIANDAYGGSSNPRTLVKQMTDKSSNYASTDLAMIVAGGNDAADLAGAYIQLATARTETAQNIAFQKLSFVLGQMGITTNGTDVPQKGVAYMQALADTFATQIQSQMLSKGATHVALLDIPDITLTPRFTMTLASIAQANADAATQIKQLIQTWVSAYNSQIRQKLGGDTRVVIVPFYADFTDEVANPGDYRLTDVTTPACPSIGVELSTGLPTYDFPTCNSTQLDSTPNKTAGWWKTYAFSDSFHPTPYGHQLLAASVSRALARAGWL